MPDEPAPKRGVPASARGIGLDRRSQRAYRLPMGAGDVERYRAIATDLISLAPDATSLPSHITGTRLGERLRLSGGVPYLPHGVLLDRYPE
jgi:hypothetical protein